MLFGAELLVGKYEVEVADRKRRHPVEVSSCKLNRPLSVAEIGLIETTCVVGVSSSVRGTMWPMLLSREANGRCMEVAKVSSFFIWYT